MDLHTRPSAGNGPGRGKEPHRYMRLDEAASIQHRRCTSRNAHASLGMGWSLCSGKPGPMCYTAVARCFFECWLKNPGSQMPTRKGKRYRWCTDLLSMVRMVLV